MPYQKIDGTVVTRAGVTTLQNVDYNLQNVNDQSKSAYGLSVQLVYTSGGAFDWTLKLQGSNDGVNFSDIVGSSLNITANGNTIFDVGNPNYRILRVVATPTSGTVTFVLTYNAVNLS
ncbi:hypothetical protein LCGC14_1877230 [marine sediment metagenome]|uniref:Uncharacterized protein n=1 Tax=marine sediment metagenome TaxID=412755 RepID=A0A0F9J1W1_9ZZZZ